MKPTNQALKQLHEMPTKKQKELIVELIFFQDELIRKAEIQKSILMQLAI